MKKIYLILFALLSGSGLSVFAQSFPFAFTGSVQTFTVPPGVTSVGFQAQGAMGGLNSTESSLTCSGSLPDRQGYGACVKGTMTVTPGQVLNIYVGGAGTDGIRTGCVATAGTGGYNGGGNGAVGYGPYSGGGGGGESDIRIGGIGIANIVVVAAGGGGAGGNFYYDTDYERGGDGGTLTGEDGYGDSSPGSSGGATGGSPSSGGAPGSYAGWTTGLPGLQSIGGAAGSPSGGGGGGAGYWGGGGGCWGGGGGGSSYTDPICSFVVQSRGCNSTGDGSVVICLTDPGVITGAKPLCSGQTLSLGETITGGKWSSSNTAIATVDSTKGIVTGVSGGLVSISYTIATPCATVYAVTTITVIESPLPITGVDSVCAGSAISLHDASSGGAWSSSNTALATVTGTGIVVGVYPGTPTISYTIPSGGCSSTLTVKVNGIYGPTDVCAGSTVTLVSTTGGGVWTSSNPLSATVDPTGVVTGVSIGTSIISYSSPACPEHVVMTVNPIAPVLGADSICVSGSAYFTDIVGIGSWSSSNNLVATVSGIPGLVSGVSSGTALISFVSPAGCLATGPVRVIDLPKPVTGLLHVCPGTSTTLQDSTASGVWSSMNTSVATTSPTGVVTGVNADTTSILYTIRPGCSTGAVVKVNPLPAAITGRDTLCPGVTDTMYDVSLGGLWSSSTPAADTIIDTNGIVTTRLSGPGTITYTLPTGCMISRNIEVYPVPSPIITYYQPTNTFYAPLGFPHYQWYDSISGKIPLANSPSLAGIYTQWYYLVITDTNGCLSTSAIYHFNEDILGVKSTTMTEIKVYPNPVTNMVYIEAPVHVRAVVSGADGKTEIDRADAKELDISRLAPGVYLISLYDDSGQVIATRKLVKQ